jgi:cellulose synthase/poly-beta-1,6-N-acetylglucosamine synthase-like glycosyltransferase
VNDSIDYVYAGDPPWERFFADTVVDMPAYRDDTADTLADMPALQDGSLGWFSPAERHRRARIVALVPAYNEEDHIASTVESLLAQSRQLDDIVIIANGCKDKTAEIARRYPVTVLELPRLKHKKSEALNIAWHRYGRDADIIIGVDGDTWLAPDATAHWEREFSADESLGGSSTQPVMTGNSLLSRIQRAEFSRSVMIGLRRGGVSVISGTGCAFRGEALIEASRIEGQAGPWTYKSTVEDYFITYMLRKLGWKTIMSPSAWCYTGSMTTLKTLWHQRIKWQAGTAHDLVQFGFNKLNWREWMNQVFGLLCIMFWVLWPALNIAEALAGHFAANWTWLVFPVFFSATEVIHAWRIRGRDWVDMVIAGTLVSATVYSFLAMGWVAVSWWKVIRGDTDNLWAAQAIAEGLTTATEENAKAEIGGVR